MGNTNTTTNANANNNNNNNNPYPLIRWLNSLTHAQGAGLIAGLAFYSVVALFQTIRFHHQSQYYWPRLQRYPILMCTLWPLVAIVVGIFWLPIVLFWEIPYLVIRGAVIASRTPSSGSSSSSSSSRAGEPEVVWSSSEESRCDVGPDYPPPFGLGLARWLLPRRSVRVRQVGSA